MKTLLFFIITGIVVFFVFKGGSFLKSSYNSELIDVSFSFPAKMTVSTDSVDAVGISYAKPSTNQIMIYRRVISNPTSSLSFTLSRDFSSSVSNERTEIWGRNGLIFSWKSVRGEERAFAFVKGRYLYVISTFGIDEKGQSIKDIEIISKSLLVDE